VSIARALQQARLALAEADPRHPAIVAALATIDVGLMTTGADCAAAQPLSGDMVPVANAAQICGRSKLAMVRYLRRHNLCQKIGGRWMVSETALRDHFAGRP